MCLDESSKLFSIISTTTTTAYITKLECHATRYGCCSDGYTPATGPEKEGMQANLNLLLFEQPILVITVISVYCSGAYNCEIDILCNVRCNRLQLSLECLNLVLFGPLSMVLFILLINF